jgi:hypothetical protein
MKARPQVEAITGAGPHARTPGDRHRDMGGTEAAHAPRHVLVLGASYGSLLGTKLLMAGHRVTLVCTRPTAQRIGHEGTFVRFPVGVERREVEVASRELPGRLDAAAPEDVDPLDADLVVLAMQEPQLASPSVKALMGRIAASQRPCLAIMNMPPLPYLARLAQVRTAALAACYADADVWRGFDPACMSLASPDAQASRPPGARNLLQVGLPTNFKAAPFGDDASTALLRRLADDIARARYVVDGTPTEIPVKLKVHDSLHVPLAKWPMLIAGNYRCIRADGMVSIAEAVHGDLQASRQLYDWTCGVCRAIGADESDLVPFDKYASAAQVLAKPSSAARAIDAGVARIERVDRLVQQVALQRGLRSPVVDAMVRLVDQRLDDNNVSLTAAFAA